MFRVLVFAAVALTALTMLISADAHMERTAKAPAASNVQQAQSSVHFAGSKGG